MTPPETSTVKRQERDTRCTEAYVSGGGANGCPKSESHARSLAIWLGSFPAPDMAARAYDVAAYCLKGAQSATQFSGRDRPVATASSCAARDIQAAAALAAKAVVVNKKTRSSDSDDCGGDDFWGEIELPELVEGGREAWTSESDYWSSPEVLCTYQNNFTCPEIDVCGVDLKLV